jgi:hypothetical protein
MVLYIFAASIDGWDGGHRIGIVQELSNERAVREGHGKLTMPTHVLPATIIFLA